MSSTPKTIDDLRTQVVNSMEQPETSMHRTEALFVTLGELLMDGGHFAQPVFAPLNLKSGRKTVSVHGYDYDDEQDTLTLIYFIDCHQEREMRESWQDASCSTAMLERALSDLAEIVKLVREGALPGLEEADPAAEMLQLIGKFAGEDLSKICLCVWTTGELSKVAWRRTDDSDFHTQAWDAKRFCKLLESGGDLLEIDFSDYGGVDCLLSDHDYGKLAMTGSAVLLGKIPGNCLAEMYYEHRTRLLQQNVRAFLRFTSSVNKGIRETILNEPQHFLSYNNGIAATASSVVLEKRAPGVYSLRTATDFQIVNGGQTTASLMHSRWDRNADLSAIQVAMKLTIVRPDDLGTLVPRISQYANSQNKVNAADFASNNPWLVKLEEISRKTEAPKDEKSNGQALRWYFERVLGQYNVEMEKQPTVNQKVAFKERNPARARFNKTDLGTAALTWDAEPHVVGLGRQKCFGIFIGRIVKGRDALGEGHIGEPSVEDFRRLVAVMILRREAAAACRELQIGSYKANVIAYAIALISHRTKGGLPWAEIWSRQSIPERLGRSLRIALRGCEKAIVDGARDRRKNTTEFAKKEECWKVVQEAPIELSLGVDAKGWSRFRLADTVRTPEMIGALEVFSGIEEREWKRFAEALEKAGKPDAQVQAAKVMAGVLTGGRKPTPQQTKRLAKSMQAMRGKAGAPAFLSRLSEEDWRRISGIGSASL